MKCGASAREQLALCGCGYVEFALRRPRHFLLMFDMAEEQCAKYGETPAGDCAFPMLLGAIVATQQADVLPLCRGNPLYFVWRVCACNA